MMESGTATLLVGALFLLIAIVGGGFSAKEITMPSIPRWARIVSAVLGFAFVLLFIFTTLAVKIPILPSDAILLYSDNQSDITPHEIEFVQLEAKAAHNPPLVNDLVNVIFSIRNAGSTPITLWSGAFIGVFNPNLELITTQRFYEGRTLQPNEVLKIETSIVVDSRGTWLIWPCYTVIDKSINDGFCPEGWKQFSITVE